MVVDSELDGLMLVVPDYVKDLDAIAKKTLMPMSGYGVTSHIGSA